MSFYSACSHISDGVFEGMPRDVKKAILDKNVAKYERGSSTNLMDRLMKKKTLKKEVGKLTVIDIAMGFCPVCGKHESD